MDAGIYKLFWPDTGLFYIGQSVNIPIRLRHHISVVSRNRHVNMKVQMAYNSFGYPEI